METTEELNNEFERELIKAVKLHCKCDPWRYVEVTLNDMWVDGRYEDNDGTLYYHEIRGSYTLDGIPYIVRLP